MKYPEDYINKIICGDCLEVMREMPEKSIDTIITNPPHILEFTGEEGVLWKGKPAKVFNTKCKGKSGKFKNLPNYTRENNVQCLNCKKWKFSSTPCNCDNPEFPNTQQLVMIQYQKWFKPICEEMLRVTKPGGTLLCFAGTRTQHRVACAIEDAGWVVKDCIMYLYGMGFPKATAISKPSDKRRGAKHLSEAWDGWKSHGLKPAYEPIIVAMKPNEGSYANNAVKYGVAGLNIDGGRIGETGGKCEEKGKNKGRFPANVILDEEASDMLEKQNGVSRFFYCAKANKAERGVGNNHPTVKPLKLMNYLCLLTKTPTGGIVLDPFGGSGTTGLACKATSRDFIIIENSKDNCEIAEKRLLNTPRLL